MQIPYRILRRNRLSGKANQTDPRKWTAVKFMISRAHQRPAAGVCQVGICLVLALMHPAAPASANRLDIPASWASRPYLTVMQGMALRFQDPPPPPAAPVIHMDAASRPQSVALPHDSGPAANDVTLPAKAPVEAEPAPAAPSAAPSPVSAVPSDKEAAEKPAASPPAILPDDTKPKVRAEDFLPFFQFPGTASTNDVPVAPAPAEPGKLPPSSATYRQQ